MPGMKRPPVPLGGVCLVGCFFVVSARMMLGCFAVVTRGVRMVLSADCLCCSAAFLDIGVFPLFGAPLYLYGRHGTSHQRKRSFLTNDVSRSVAISKQANLKFNPQAPLSTPPGSRASTATE
jgi:hypothetical protein